eukprot:1876047-Amphidinium_carterae.2
MINTVPKPHPCAKVNPALIGIGTVGSSEKVLIVVTRRTPQSLCLQHHAHAHTCGCMSVCIVTCILLAMGNTSIVDQKEACKELPFIIGIRFESFARKRAAQKEQTSIVVQLAFNQMTITVDIMRKFSEEQMKESICQCGPT